MSILQRTLRTFVLAAAAMAGQLGYADSGYHPFSEPMNFDPDWQFFAPVQLQDLEDLTARQRAPHGFYVTYDRVYTAMSRPENQNVGYTMDSTWGNRWDFGWMSKEESGWAFSYQQVMGPNVYNGWQQLRLDGFNSDDTNDITDPYYPTVFGNDPYTLQRTYDLAHSVNVGDFTSFEANKTWRLEPYRYGGMLEPLIGLRYAKFIDTARDDVYSVFDVTDPTDPTSITGQGEILLNDIVWSRNDMILGQIGFRYFKNWRRFTWSSDFKVFAGHTFQTQETTRLITTTTYDGIPPGIGDPPTFDGDHIGTSFSSRKNNETPVGFDLRTEGAFKATKWVDLRMGFQMIYFGQGIWRGSTLSSQGRQFETNQQLVMPGLTFGFAINR